MQIKMVLLSSCYLECSVSGYCGRDIATFSGLRSASNTSLHFLVPMLLLTLRVIFAPTQSVGAKDKSRCLRRTTLSDSVLNSADSSGSQIWWKGILRG